MLLGTESLLLSEVPKEATSNNSHPASNHQEAFGQPITNCPQRRVVDITHQSSSASTPTEKANLLNHFFFQFSTCFTQTDIHSPDLPINAPSGPTLSSVSCTQWWSVKAALHPEDQHSIRNRRYLWSNASGNSWKHLSRSHCPLQLVIHNRGKHAHLTFMTPTCSEWII